MRVLALVLIVSMTPAVHELVEAGAHLLEHGHLGHLAADGHPEPAGDEHGCSALFHHCGCHTATSMAQASASAATPPPPGSTLLARGPDGHDGRGAPQPPHRPPIV